MVGSNLAFFAGFDETAPSTGLFFVEIFGRTTNSSSCFDEIAASGLFFVEVFGRTTDSSSCFVAIGDMLAYAVLMQSRERRTDTMQLMTVLLFWKESKV